MTEEILKPLAKEGGKMISSYSSTAVRPSAYDTPKLKPLYSLLFLKARMFESSFSVSF